MAYRKILSGDSQYILDGGALLHRIPWHTGKSYLEIANEYVFILLFMHFCPGTMTTHAESINSDLQRGLDRGLRHTQH